MISFGFYEINTVAKGETNEQSAHSGVHIISISSKIRFLDHKKSYVLPDNLAESGPCSPEVGFWQSRIQVDFRINGSRVEEPFSVFCNSFLGGLNK